VAKKDETKLIADQAKEIANLKAQLSARDETNVKASEKLLDISSQLIANKQRQLEVEDDIAATEKLIQRIVTQQQKAVEKGNHEQYVLFKKMERNKKTRLEILKNEKDTVKATIDQSNQLQKQLKLLKQRQEFGEKYSETFEDSLDWLDDIDGTIKNIPIVGGFLSKALGTDKLKEDLVKKFEDGFAASEDAAAGAEDAILDVAGGVDAAAAGTEAMGAGIEGSIGPALGLNAAMGPILLVALAIAAAVELFKKGLEVDQEVTDMARGLGISREEAEHIHHELLGVAEGTEVIGANAEAMSAAFSEVANAMGSIKMVTKEMAESQVLLTKQYGLAGEDAAAFQKMANLSGRTAEQNVVAIQGITEGMTGGMMNYKAVMKDVASTSKAVQATFKGNIGQLTKAVITARKFGTTLDEVKSITDGLLDIEGSLEKEMEARVLTGKDINLDQARALKLKGDEAGAMEEIMKQAGGYNELMKMAPYQQEALAAAAGMTVDQLVKGTEQQKLFDDMSKELGITLDKNGKMTEEQMAIAMASTNEEAKKLVLQQQQASAQEKMAAMGDKLSAIFTKISEPIMDILDPLITMVDDLFPVLKVTIGAAFAPLKWALNTLGFAVDTVKLLWDAFKWVGSAINTSLGDPLGAVYDVLKGISNFFGKIGDSISNWWGGVKDFVANKGETKPDSKGMHDGMIAPDGGLMVSGEKGTYQLHSDDTVVAGTGLGSVSKPNTTSTSTSSGADTSEMIALLKQIAAAMNQPVIVKIGNKVVNEIDKVQTMNRSYVGKVDNSYGAV
jgi:hypothetical protein